jgi:rhodanese-related sulfurtransferase
MPTRLMDREQVRTLTEQGGQLVEVLPRAEYDWAHPAGAVHLWLRDIDREALKRLDMSRPVIVYCNDFL